MIDAARTPALGAASPTADPISPLAQAELRPNLKRERIAARAALGELLDRLERDGWPFTRADSLKVDALVATIEAGP